MNRLASWARKWWPGLIPLVLLWIAAIWNSTAPLEADLAGRSAAALKETVLDMATTLVRLGLATPKPRQ